ncbi:hypothetical protein, partial [Acidihalobacter prosperus]
RKICICVGLNSRGELLGWFASLGSRALPGFGQELISLPKPRDNTLALALCSISREFAET